MTTQGDAADDDDAIMLSLPRGEAVALPGEFRPLDVVSPDGVRIAAQSWGNPAKPAITFIHGFAQAHLSWLRQTRSALAQSFHLVTFDLRGHGASDKPMDPACYTEDRRWVDDIAAVLDAASVRRTILVAWSFGVRRALDFIAADRTGRVLALNLVGAGASSRVRGHGSAPLRPLMRSADLSKNVSGTREFLRRCFHRQPDQRTFEEMLAYNMVTPPAMRAAMLSGTGQPEDVVAQMRLPVLVTFGLEDALASLQGAQFAAALLPNATLSLYEDVGHAPFFEAPERFNAELEEFARRAHAAAPA